jgi:hypothetical protein
MNIKESYAAVLARRYELWGRDVEIRSPKTGSLVTLRLIDLTRGVEIGDAVDVATVSPAASARKSDLTALGLSPTDLIGVDITLNDVVWTVRSHQPKPGPHGPETAEVYLMLVTPCV